ncbi:NAD(P)H-dependent oxidoreductase [Leptotrichia sp. oral taxon 218]|nr:NAD(P)H-dependent oxidoreductase [Leptotrichia sp. oral taxon 218]
MKWNINYKIDYGKKEIKVKTVIFSHPWNGSFNKAILDKVVENLEKTKEKYTIIDLNKDGFNPVMTEKDLELYSQGKSADPLVLKYQEILKNTDELILIFPIWWMSLPAILKGFLDKVMLRGFAYESGKYGIKGLLPIKSAKMITTAEAPKFLLNIMGFGMTMRKANLGGVGIKNTKWIHYSLRAKGKYDDRKKFLEKVGEFVSE